MKLFPRQSERQHGLSLVETMVAVFVLVMGITAALGLANYSLNATSSIRKQIIAMGLAREGIEAVKNMRDTNWLQENISTDCYDFASDNYTASCYKNWQNPVGGGAPGGYNIAATSRPYRLTIDASQTGLTYWGLVAESRNRYGLDFDPTANSTNGMYFSSSLNPKTHSAASSDYARALTIVTEATTGPFNQGTLGPRMKVTSQVWWKDKDCPASDAPPTTSKCQITLETYLTNWKDY